MMTNFRLGFSVPAALLLAGVAVACAGSGRSTGEDGPGANNGNPTDPNNPNNPADPNNPVIGPDGLPAGATQIPAEPQRTDGDPEEGYRALVNDGYLSIGIPWSGFSFAMTKLQPRDALPGREGNNALVSYGWNVAKKSNGMEVATTNCLQCHASHIQGKLIVGVGRQNRDLLASSSGMVSLTNSALIVGGLTSPSEYLEWQQFGIRLATTQEAGTFGAFAAQAAHRDPATLTWSSDVRFDAKTGLNGWVDVPPWWRTKKKNGLYANGMGRGDHSRHMMNASIFSVKDVAEAKRIDTMFTDIAAYLRSIEPPKFPGKIDAKLAAAGEQTFNARCASCHGTYGADETYPNLIIDVKTVGTDPELAVKSWVNDAAVQWWADSYYGQPSGTSKGSRYERSQGYVAPPLDGIWVTAPFLHNASVPTLEAVLDSSKRPVTWSSAFGDDDFDLDAVGWKLGGDGLVYDTTKPGFSNAGHTFGDSLSDDQRRGVLEYLKTL